MIMLIGLLKRLKNWKIKWFSILKKTKKDIIMTQEDKENYRDNNICRFCEKKIESDKVCDHSHLTGKYRRPAHNTCNINVK